eukprot:13524786-Heterocapsa_arctica.AAC.1
MKDEWTRIHLSIEGKRENPTEVELAEFDPNQIFGCPPEHLDHPVVEAPAINGVPPLPPDPMTALMGEGNELDMFGGIGIELNRKGQRCRRDKANKLYPIDAYGTNIVKGEYSRPRD